jgi:hypothetical protein
VNNKNVDLKTGLSKLSLLNDGDSNKVNSLCNDKMEDDDNFEGACGGEDPKDDEKVDIRHAVDGVKILNVILS